MKTDFNHWTALWQLFFRKISILQGFGYSFVFYIFHFYRRYQIQPLKDFSIYNHTNYEFILFLFLGYLFQLILLKSKVFKYGYLIGETYLSIFEGKLDFNWSISKSEEIRFLYKNIKQAVVRQNIFGSYLLEIQPSGLSITQDLKIRSIKGFIYGLTKEKADNLASVLNEKIKSAQLLVQQAPTSYQSPSTYDPN